MTEPTWDESQRPTGPAPDPARVLSAAERAAGQHLVEVHDHLRGELGQVRDLVEQVAAGELPAGQARSHLQAMTLRQNDWTLGAYCAAYCRVVTTHHAIEDASVFPHLRAGDPTLAPVLDRLSLEHGVVHHLIEAVDRALVAHVAGDLGLDGVRRAVDRLATILLSHLAYEERELVEPLSRLGFF